MNGDTEPPAALESDAKVGASAVDRRVAHALTVDVEDWFHPSLYSHLVDRPRWSDFEARVSGSTGKLLDLFDEYSVSGTFFVLGWIAERDGDLIREIHGRGHEIGSHGFSHRPLHQLTPAEFRDELSRTNDAIGGAVGLRPTGFRAPDFSLDARSAWALDVLLDQGFTYDSSIFPIRHRRYGVPSFPRGVGRLRADSGRTIEELPLTTRRLAGQNWGAAGGAYLRLLPTRLTTSAFAQMERNGLSGCLYVHPWEVDDDQPRLAVDPVTRYRHTGRTRTMCGRLGRVIEQFRFVPAEQCVVENRDLARDPLRLRGEPRSSS